MRTSSTAVFIAVIITGLVFTAGCSRQPADNSDVPTVQEAPHIFIDDVKIYIEMAFTPEQRATGLMHRKKLEENHGMLFVYPEDQILSFWMKNTYIPLSIAFIKNDGTIVGITDMEPETEDRHISPEPARYALEVNQGWFQANNIKVGSMIGDLP